MTIQNEVRALLAAATPGPWEAGDCWVYTQPIYSDDPRLMNVLGMSYIDPDRAEEERLRGNVNAALIARAPELLAALCDKLDEAEMDRDLFAAINRAGDEGVLARAEKAEAAIERVRALIDRVEHRMMATAKPQEMRDALDGE